MFYFYVINAVTCPLINFIDPVRFFKWALIKFYKRKKEHCLLTQQEANRLCEEQPHEIELGYADILNTMYITVMYIPVVPIGQLISLIGLVIYYWVEKYVLFKRKTVKKT